MPSFSQGMAPVLINGRGSREAHDHSQMAQQKHDTSIWSNESTMERPESLQPNTE